MFSSFSSVFLFPRERFDVLQPPGNHPIDNIYTGKNGERKEEMQILQLLSSMYKVWLNLAAVKADWIVNAVQPHSNCFFSVQRST